MYCYCLDTFIQIPFPSTPAGSRRLPLCVQLGTRGGTHARHYESHPVTTINTTSYILKTLGDWRVYRLYRPIRCIAGRRQGHAFTVFPRIIVPGANGRCHCGHCIHPPDRTLAASSARRSEQRSNKTFPYRCGITSRAENVDSGRSICRARRAE